jgi:hypothetical protein
MFWMAKSELPHPERERSEQSKDARVPIRPRDTGEVNYVAAVAMMNMRRNGNSVLPSARRG